MGKMQDPVHEFCSGQNRSKLLYCPSAKDLAHTLSASVCTHVHTCTQKITQGSVNQLVKCTLIKTVNFFISECTCKIVPNGILHFQCRTLNAAIPFYDNPGITVLAFP